MSNTQRMGRGLSALFERNPYEQSTITPPVQQEPPSQFLSLSRIIPNPHQPRKHFSEESLAELATSIVKQGIIQPLLVRAIPDSTTFELVAGERRWRAAKLAGLTEVPVFVREFSDEELMIAALIENMQREDLSPMEEAWGLHNLREACGITQEELSVRIGKSRSSVANALRLLQLSTLAQEDLQAGRMGAGHARAILSLAEHEEAQENLRVAIVERALTVRDAEAAVHSFKSAGLFPWQPVQNDNSIEQIPTEPAPIPQRIGRTKTYYSKSLQKHLGEHLNIKASVSGTEEYGRITLTYTKAEELQRILQTMGMDNTLDATLKDENIE